VSDHSTAADHAELPHPPEAAGTQPPAGPDMEVVGGGILTLDHPVSGLLNRHNVLAA
jgi:hypothetical protein